MQKFSATRLLHTGTNHCTILLFRSWIRHLPEILLLLPVSEDVLKATASVQRDRQSQTNWTQNGYPVLYDSPHCPITFLQLNCHTTNDNCSRPSSHLENVLPSWAWKQLCLFWIRENILFLSNPKKHFSKLPHLYSPWLHRGIISSRLKPMKILQIWIQYISMTAR